LKYSCSPFAIYIELLMDFIEEVLLEKIKVNNKLETILEEFIIPDSTSVITSSSEKVKPNSSKSSTFLGSMIWPTFVPTFGKYATTIGGKKSKNKNKTRKIKRNYSKKRKSNKGKKAKKLRKSKK